jgi:hypothetical protein
LCTTPNNADMFAGQRIAALLRVASGAAFLSFIFSDD